MTTRAAEFSKRDCRECPACQCACAHAGRPRRAAAPSTQRGTAMGGGDDLDAVQRLSPLENLLVGVSAGTIEVKLLKNHLLCGASSGHACTRQWHYACRRACADATGCRPCARNAASGDHPAADAVLQERHAAGAAAHAQPARPVRRARPREPTETTPRPRRGQPAGRLAPLRRAQTILAPQPGPSGESVLLRRCSGTVA